MFTVATNSQTHETYTGPFEPSAYHIGIKAGIAPTAWLSRKLPIENVNVAVGDNLPTLDISTSEQLAHSKEIGERLPIPLGYVGMLAHAVAPSLCFSLPTWVAVEVGYAYSDYLELFGEFAWFQARGNTFYEQVDPRQLPKQEVIGPFSTETTQSFGGYVGFKQYGDPYFNCINPYWGLKIGVLRHGDIEVTCNNIPKNEYTDLTKLTRKVFVPNIVISGGITFGFDVRLSDCFRFHFGVEVIASGGRKGNANFIDLALEDLQTPVPYSNHTIGTVKDYYKGESKDILENIEIPDHFARAKVEDLSFKAGIEDTEADLFFPITFGFVFEF